MAAAFFLSAKKNKVVILPACALNLIALKWAIVVWYQALKLCGNSDSLPEIFCSSRWTIFD
jgi:hypothetical protein